MRICSLHDCGDGSNPGSAGLKWPWTFLVAFLCLSYSHGRTLLDSFHDSGNTLDKMPESQQLSSIDYSLYHRSDILLKEVKALVDRHQNKLSMKILKELGNGYSAEIAVITFACGQDKAEDKQKIRILLNFGQHGRELITSEVALRLLSVLAGEYHLQGLDRSVQTDILQKVIIKVVPMENLNGRRIVEAGKLCERKNGRGVDTNRNWSVDWGKKEKDYDPSEEYPGVAPFSEPETRIMRKLAHSFKPHIWVNVHSGMEALFMPYDHRNITPDGATAELMKLMLQRLNHMHCKDKCVVGSGGGSVGYLAHGTSTDYMYEIVKVPLAFTFEIFGDPKASSDDCFRMFNPLDSFMFENVLENWCFAFFRMFMNLPNELYNLSTEDFGTMEDFHINSLNRSDFHRRRKIWTSGQSLFMSSDQMFEWGTERMKTMSQFLFLSSAFLIILLCFRTSKCIRLVQSTVDNFCKP